MSSIIEEAEEQSLRRGLSNRHIQLIAIGGAIGTGLFLGSGKGIHAAGPSIIFVYMLIGFMLYFVMRAMGELLLFKLEYKSFQDFAADILGPWAGFLVGWSYWFTWVVVGMADLIAIIGYWEYWVGPDHRGLAMALATGVLVLLLLMNLASVRLFGEMEFWFAIIKLVAIVALIVVAAVMVVIGFTSPNGSQASLTNLWDARGHAPNGMFPTGISGFLAGIQLAIFAFVGVELVGTTAAETENPRVTLPRAINAIPVRIIIFYVLALIAVMCVTPWYEVDPSVSPFVMLFGLAGLSGAATVVNMVVLSSASSSLNSGVYSTSRMLFGLAHQGMAHQGFRKLTRAGVPWRGLVLTVAIILSAQFLSASGGLMRAFTIVTTLASVLFIFVWSMILVSYIVYLRRWPEAHEASEYKMPGARFMPWVLLAFFAFVLVVLAFDGETLTGMAIAPIWFAILIVCWLRMRKRRGGTMTTWAPTVIDNQNEATSTM